MQNQLAALESILGETMFGFAFSFQKYKEALDVCRFVLFYTSRRRFVLGLIHVIWQSFI